MKKLILGLVIGMLIGTATVAFAASNDLIGKEVKAVFATFNLKVNGEVKKLETAPLVYNGTSYLPVKDLANLVGFDVTYKADSRTIELNASETFEKTIETGDVPKLNEWVTYSEIRQFYNDGYLTGTKDGVTNLKFLNINLDFKVSLEKVPTNPYTTKSIKGDVSILIYNGQVYFKRTELKNLSLEMPDEWISLRDLSSKYGFRYGDGKLANDKISYDIDFNNLKDVKKMTPVSFTNSKGDIRVMISEIGTIINIDDLKRDGLVIQ